MDHRQAFEAFFAANEVEEVSDTFDELLKGAELEPTHELRFQLLERLSEVYENVVSFRYRKIFDLLRDALKKRQPFRKDISEGTKVFISGAGPCGLRTAVECALLGFDVTIIEKRKTFSRANILTLWTQTKEDLVLLGSKFFYPEMKTHGFPLHLGTREIQLCLLKTSLLLGASILYQTELVGFIYDIKEQVWCAQVRPTQKKTKKEKRASALEFKPLKTGDYQKTYTCNMVDYAEADLNFINKTIPGESVHRIPFHFCVIAEGEWSQTCRKLGFEKTIDRFNQAIGMVINMTYDKTNKQEAKLKSFTSSSMYQIDEHLKRLRAENINCENIEYLKGRTHYIAITIAKDTLHSSGIVKDKNLSSQELLTDSNLDVDALESLAKKVSLTIGLPESTKFYESNPVQVFDFSTRARARDSIKFLVADPKSGKSIVKARLTNEEADFDKAPLDQRSFIAPITPIGDALIEPFWPQGLGTNRGFHSCLDATHAILIFQNEGNTSVSQERNFAFNTMNSVSWNIAAVNNRKFWTIDPLTRYNARGLKAGIDRVKRRREVLPERFEDSKLVLAMEKCLRELPNDAEIPFDVNQRGFAIPKGYA